MSGWLPHRHSTEATCRQYHAAGQGVFYVHLSEHVFVCVFQIQKSLPEEYEQRRKDVEQQMKEVFERT